MTTERIRTEYTANTDNFRRGARVYDQTLAKQERLTNTRLTRIDARWDRSTRDIMMTRTALAGLTGLVGGAALGQLRNYAEGWRDVERRLQSIGETSDAAGKKLVGVALRSRTDIAGTAAAIQRLAKSTGADLDATSRRVETLQKLLASGGASAGERASVSLQLGQALQAGVLSGDEYKSIAENAPVELLDALAKAAGITRGELKAFAAEQKLTTKVVLQALDDLASTADDKFGALAVSGSEAFGVLQTGLTVYAGNVDEALGATQAINGVMMALGEYLTDVEGGATSLAKALKVVAAVALTTAGARGMGAVNAVMQQSSVAARQAVRDSHAQVAASSAKVAAARREVAASRELIAQRQAEIVARLQGNKKATRAVASLANAKKKSAAASAALMGAEARAAIATDRLAAAQVRLSVAARASAAAMRAARGVLAFFGGPAGLAFSALVALPLLLSESGEKSDGLRAAADQARDAMDRFADASKRAGNEQATMGGKVTAATQAVLSQSRVELQSTLATLRKGRAALIDDMQGNGLFDLSELSGPIATINRSRNSGSRGNPFLADAQAALRDLQNGSGDLQQIVAALTEVRGVGSEARQVMRDYDQAVVDQAVSLEDARAKMLDYASAAGVFRNELNAIEAAEGPEAQRRAYDNLAQALGQAAEASAIMGGSGVDAVADIARELSRAEIQVAAYEAALAGNTEEAARLQAILDDATGSAVDLANTPTPDYSGAAASASGLADQLERAVSAAINLRSQAISGLQRAKIDAEFRTDPVGRAGALAGAQFDAELDGTGMMGPFPQDQLDDIARRRDEYIALEVEAEQIRQSTIAANKADAKTVSGGKSGKGGGSSAAAAKDAERDLASARGLLLENGQKALFIEQELNAERERLRELMPALIKMGLSKAEADAVVNSELERTEKRLGEVKTASEEAAAAFARGILSDIRAADSLEDAIGRIADRLMDLALDPVFDMLANQFASFVGGMFGGGGGGGGGAGARVAATLNAKGNAFSPSGIQAFARGGVVDRATAFRFGGDRLGVMGEAGPEAILPLRRDGSGNLGVIAQTPTVPTAPVGGVISSSFSWSGDMIINSESDDPQAVGSEVMTQMQSMFERMFSARMQTAMRAGGVLDQQYKKKGGR
ncbi:tape measure protein [Sagittula sp. NFXS13]|uniref:tape measure protein n=1 Tax=Sagittula sp. NFXS13 TaxID=2819095 RepID=UPI0032DF4BCE